MTDSIGLNFTLKVKSIPITIENKDGQFSTYTLRELSGSERDIHLTDLVQRSIPDASGKPTGNIRTVKGMQSNLLTLCLIDEKGKNVLPNIIDSWPSRVVQALYERAQDLSGLTGEALEAAGKD